MAGSVRSGDGLVNKSFIWTILELGDFVAAQTNYEDDAVFLSANLRNLRTSLALDIDSDIFLNKVVQDILFHSDVLNKLYNSLYRNNFLIQRLDLLRLIMLGKHEFIQFIGEIKQLDTPFSKDLSAFTPQFLQCCTNHQADIQAIMIILDGTTAEDAAESDLISPDEYRFLFQPDDESDVVKV
jgi:hypothetical protein